VNSCFYLINSKCDLFGIASFFVTSQQKCKQKNFSCRHKATISNSVIARKIRIKVILQKNVTKTKKLFQKQCGKIKIAADFRGSTYQVCQVNHTRWDQGVQLHKAQTFTQL